MTRSRSASRAWTRSSPDSCPARRSTAARAIPTRACARPRHLPQPAKRTKGPRYTPVAKRQDKPDGIAWLQRHHPELKDSQIANLIGTTKNTIQAVRDRSHWNSQNIRPRDPVLLGLCSQSELNAVVEKARRAAERAGREIPPAPTFEESDESAPGSSL